MSMCGPMATRWSHHEISQNLEHGRIGIKISISLNLADACEISERLSNSKHHAHHAHTFDTCRDHLLQYWNGSLFEATMSAFIPLLNTLRPRQNVRHFTDDTLKRIFLNEFEFRLKCHWSSFTRVQLAVLQHWFRYWLGADQAPSHYLNHWWLDHRRIYASLGLNELSYRNGTQDERRKCHWNFNGNTNILFLNGRNDWRHFVFNISLI